MLMPTAVAVGSTGRVYVADGVNHRIVEFDDSGRYLGSFHAVGDEGLSRPMSIKVDDSGSLWIADTGHARVLVRGSGGQLVRVITLPEGQASPPDLTDIALTNAQTLWLVDNDGHRLIRHDLTSGVQTAYGRHGEARGQFQYPFMIAADKSGLLYVSDTINGRVQAVRDLTTVPRVFGSYGVEPGQFHRPKGVAVDSAGRIIVADGSLGVVQYFAADGSLIDALRDESGAVFRFDSPCGIAAHGDMLYVTELIPGHVRKLRIEAREVKATFEPPRKRQLHTQPTTCTACHLEWMPHFSEGAPTELATPPATRPDEPYVSRSESCLTCHDGSVVDSRRNVWRDHGHQTGIVPMAGMKVPADLPLVDGKVACRTCHSAHTHGGAGAGIADAVFLRVDKHPDELCIRCHTGFQGGVPDGMHPTAGFSQPLSHELVTAGSRYSFEPAGTGCLICHTGHGSRADRLLLPTGTTDALCASCHSEMLIPSDHVGGATRHPLDARLTVNQLASLKTMGTSATSDAELQCISCHKVHHAIGTTALLARPQEGSQLCMECHSTYSGILGSAHDLSRSGGSDRVLLEDCDVAGPCAACHGVHSPPRPAVVTKIDREGSCVTCHQAGACAQSNTGMPFLHPIDIPKDMMYQLSAFTGRASADSVQGSTLTCLSCHDPHSNSNDVHAMLRIPDAAPASALCFECHSEMRPISQSFHGAERMGHGANSQSDCDSCHAVHAPSPTWGGDSWIAPLAPANHPVGTQRCTGCHSVAGGRHEVAFKEHPALPMSNMFPEDHPGFMPLVDSNGKQSSNGAIGCITCHLPHGRSESGGFIVPNWATTPEPLIHAAKPMLRPFVAPNLCSSCHASDGLRLFLYFHKDVGDASQRDSEPAQR